MYDIQCVRHRMKMWQELMPQVDLFYASKVNPDKEIAREVVKQDGGFHVTSCAEIEQAVSLGCNLDNIILASPIKNKPEIELARKLGVKRMMFDTTEELYKLKTWYPKAELILRIAS